MTTTQSNINWLAKAVINNSIDNYAVLNTDGSCEVGNQVCYSSILQCGHDMAQYGIAAMIQCQPDMDLEDAKEYVIESLQDY